MKSDTTLRTANLLSWQHACTFQRFWNKPAVTQPARHTHALFPRHSLSIFISFSLSFFLCFYFSLLPSFPRSLSLSLSFSISLSFSFALPCSPSDVLQNPDAARSLEVCLFLLIWDGAPGIELHSFRHRSPKNVLEAVWSLLIASSASCTFQCPHTETRKKT